MSKQKSYTLHRSILVALSLSATVLPSANASKLESGNAEQKCDSSKQACATPQEKARGFNDKNIAQQRKLLVGINPNTTVSPSVANGGLHSAKTSNIAPTLTSELVNNVPLTGLTGASGSDTFYTFTVPTNVNSLAFTMAGGTGDADLYVLYGSQPTSSNYDCRPYASGNNENCVISTIQTGTYHVMLSGYSAYDGVSLTASYLENGQTPALPDHRIAVAGDSITKAFAANCTSNYWWWDLLCPAGGDQEQYSWFDGSSNAVNSVFDRYVAIDSTTLVNHSAAQSGSEMRGGSNNLVVQATNIVNQPEQPNHVEIVLGGNDLCNRGCVDGQNCSDPIYTDNEWRESVQNGLDILMAGMPSDSSVLLGSVPRVQDIRQAGLDLQAQRPGEVDCEYLWTNYNVCSIVTQGSLLNGETASERHAGVAAAQKRYNAILAEEAASYNSNANGRNPNGVQVTAEYVNESTSSAGTFSFGSQHINGGDCFHPNVATQNLISDFMWNANPNKP